MLAYTYPLLNIFWTMLLVAGFVLWIYLLMVIFVDLFRSQDIGGVAKAAWFLFVLLLPLIGVLTYLIVRGGKMRARAEAQAEEQAAEFDAYIRQVSTEDGKTSTTDELATLADLKDRGKISDEEYEAAKKKALAS
ncbi:MAG TPA: SHOCT domain-containing protein [Acidimicrobiales bacterium]|nr:SHOCT domain-containing protein [Acidimicrobiales bacterium]